MIQTWNELSFFTANTWKTIKHRLSQDLLESKTILPKINDVYNAFTYTPFDQVKVVILGQDPYPNPEHAMGLAFSIPEYCTNIPKSLQNIFKELKADMNIDHPSGSLIGWAKQGVLLLNTSLTVIAGQPNSHQAIGWQDLISEVLAELNQVERKLIFVLWGKNAQSYGKAIRHHKIQSVHPSPLSAHNGFFGSKPFSRVNQYLQENGIQEIDWSQ